MCQAQEERRGGLSDGRSTENPDAEAHGASLVRLGQKRKWWRAQARVVWL